VKLPVVVLAGWCAACIARDLLIARDLESGRFFLVCAACGCAGTANDASNRHIKEVHELLAPKGWTLASSKEVEAAGKKGMIAAEASEAYVGLVAHFPGFQ
jgi:hypothetical protein